MSTPEQDSGRPVRPPRADEVTSTASVFERYKDALRRGHVAALRGRHEDAIDAYAAAATIAPDRALPHASVAGILAKMDRVDEAAAAFDRAFALAPSDETTLRGLAELQIRMNRRIGAAATLDRLADVLDVAGRLADATDTARRALELAESRARRAQVESLVGRLRANPGNDETSQRALDQALRLLEPAVRRSGDTHPIGREPETDVLALDAAADQATGAGELTGRMTSEGGEAQAEPAGLGIALGVAAESALHAGDLSAAHHGLLAAARAHRRAGRLVAAVDACYLAVGLAPSDPEIHLLLVELYLDRGWRSQAADKLLILGRLAELDNDRSVRDRLCAIVIERLADEPRVAGLCA